MHTNTARSQETPNYFKMDEIQSLTEELEALKAEVLKKVIAKETTGRLLDDLLRRPNA